MTGPKANLEFPGLGAGREEAAPAAAKASLGQHPPSAWSEEITHRQKVLLHAEPIFRLKIRGDARLTDEHELGHYDSTALVFKIFDLVLETMGLESELDMGGLAHAVGPLLRAMDEAAGKEPDPERHERAVRRVLDWLLNEDARREPFQVQYTDFGPGLEAETRLMPVTLMTEQFTSTGNGVPRLSPEAMNLYLNAINFPIEDRELAFAAMIRAQIDRGRLTEAEHSARAALALSIQLREQIETVLRATQRDIRQVDWETDVPEKLQAAMDHVKQRVLADRDITAAAEDKLNNLPPGSAEAQQMARIILLVELAFKQHVRLEERLIVALPTFLDEHARQAFSPRRGAAALDLAREVLEPLMRLTRAQALDITEPLVGVYSPISVPTVFWLEGLVTQLLQPRREVREHVVEMPEREIQPVGEEPLRFDAETWAAAGKWLDAVQTPTRLSDLIKQARAGEAGDAVVELVALRTLFLYAPDGESSDRLMAEKTGERFKLGAYQGDNLMLRRIKVGDAVET